LKTCKHIKIIANHQITLWVNSCLFSKNLRARHKLSIISSLNEDLSLGMNSPIALKHLSDSTEEGGIQSRQISILVSSQNAISFLM